MAASTSPPIAPKAASPSAKKTARLVSQFLDQAREILADRHPANMVLLRGFSKRPDSPSFGEVFGLRAAAIASYPMYRGVAQLVGMELLETGTILSREPLPRHLRMPRSARRLWRVMEVNSPTRRPAA